MITGEASLDTAVEALRLGAYDYLTKPVDEARLKTLLAGVKRTQELKNEISELRGELRSMGRFGKMVGTSTPMQKLYRLLEKVAPTEATVFLVGESGTGKELAAQTVHELSKRRHKPLCRGQLWRRISDAYRKRAIRPRARSLHRRRFPNAPAFSSKRITAPCFWTRSPRCP